MRRQLLFTLLAICAALLSGLVVFSSLHRDALERTADPGAVKLLAAARDLPGGAEFGPDSYKFVVWKQESVPAGALVEPAQLVNQVSRVGLLKDQPITAGQIMNREAKRGPATIPLGMRAIAAPVEQLDDGAAPLRAHAHADVLVSIGAGAEQAFCRIVLQNVEILAAGPSVSGGGFHTPNTRIVTLLVSPADAERLVLASHEGALSLALRNDADHEVVRTPGMTVAELERGGAGMAASAVRKRSETSAALAATTVEVMRNGRSIENIAFNRDREIRTVVTADEAPAGGAGADGASLPASAPAGQAGNIRVPAALQGAARLERAVQSAGASGPGGGAGYNSPNAKTVEVP